MTDEQKPEFRTRKAQALDSAGWIIRNCSSYYDVLLHVTKELSEAEARGAAEQRRKDEEEIQPVYQVTPDEHDHPWQEVTAEAFADAAKDGSRRRILYTGPATIAALEKALNDIGNEVLEGTEPFLDAVIRILKTVGIDPLNGSEPLDQVVGLEDQVAVLENRVKELEAELSATKKVGICEDCSGSGVGVADTICNTCDGSGGTK